MTGPQRGHPLNSRGYAAGAPAVTMTTAGTTTLKGSPNVLDGARLQRACIAIVAYSVGRTDPRLLKGDGFTVLPRRITPTT